jgi:hypothetical protein
VGRFSEGRAAVAAEVGLRSFDGQGEIPSFGYLKAGSLATYAGEMGHQGRAFLSFPGLGQEAMVIIV